MVSVLCQKHYGALRPADEAAEEAFRKIGAGDAVEVDIKLKRNVRHLAKYWAMVREVWGYVDHEMYRSPDDLHLAFKMACGCRKLIRLMDGTQAWVPDSVAFAAMDQLRFDQFYNSVCDLVSQTLLPEVTDKAARSRLLLALGLPPDLEG